MLLVGCKSDLRPPPGSPNSANYVSKADGRQVAAAIGAREYRECSALRAEGVDDVFEAATRASMLMRDGVDGRGGRRMSSGNGGRGKGWDDDEVGKKWGCCVIA